MNRGSAGSEGQGAVARAASMRPRFMNRGSDGGARCPAKPQIASMRPRFMNRGSDAAAWEKCLRDTMLQ